MSKKIKITPFDDLKTTDAEGKKSPNFSGSINKKPLGYGWTPPGKAWNE